MHAPQHATEHKVLRILFEGGFFLLLVLLSEVSRRIATKRAPDSQLALALLVCSLVLGWYSVSITLVLFNKWMMSDHGSKCPIFYSMTHMLFKGVISFTYQRCFRCQPLPRAGRRVLLGTAMVGVFTGLDVATSNAGFIYISVTFHTMLKSASLIFLMALGVATRLEPCSLKVSGAVFVMAGGLAMATYGEAKFDSRGFFLVLSSELFAAVRWIVTQMVLQGGSIGTLVAVFYMSPASTLTLLPLVIVAEREEVLKLANPQAMVKYLGIVTFPGFLAFVLLLIEVQLVKETSSLTLSVFGNLKSIVTILIAIVVFREETSVLQWCGLLIALTGMFGYSYIRKKAHAVDALASLGYVALLQDDMEEDSSPPRGASSPTALGDELQLAAQPPAVGLEAGAGSSTALRAGAQESGDRPAPVTTEGLQANGCSGPQVLGRPTTPCRSADGAGSAPSPREAEHENKEDLASAAVRGLDSPLASSSEASGHGSARSAGESKA